MGKALTEAMRLKRVNKAQVARHFGVRPPSVSGWVKTGRIGKERLNDLVDFFADVVGPDHWGIGASVNARFPSERESAISPGASQLIELIQTADQTQSISDWTHIKGLIEQLMGAGGGPVNNAGRLRGQK